jgi:hypothetical protein
MDYKVNYRQNSLDGYYISIIDETDWETQNDGNIAELLKLSREFYCDKIIEYNGYNNDYNQLFFKNKSDILNFKQWVESIIIANKLIGED